MGKNPKDELIDGDYVYKLTANASPVDIETVVSILLNEELEKAFESLFFFEWKKLNKFLEIDMIKVEKGLSMQILIKELNLILMKMEWENPVKIFLTKRMCELEYYFIDFCINMLIKLLL